MNPNVDEAYSSNSSLLWDQPKWTISELIALKQGRSIAVVLPALNEEATVAEVVRSISPLVGSLVDELWVIDSGSTDNTINNALAAGAQVATREQAVPHIPPVPGKGEVLWRSLAVISSDIVAFVDSDLIEPDPQFVPKLIGPLLENPELKLVKAYYRRPLKTDALHLAGAKVEQLPHAGGRVTELVARPLLAALRPEISHIIQPLGGEYAATREHLEGIPFAPGYGVEIGIVLDTARLHGVSAIGQVNLGVRMHRNRPLHELGAMSRQVAGTLLSRCGVTDSGEPLIQFTETHQSFTPVKTTVSLKDRPPFREVYADITIKNSAIPVIEISSPEITKETATDSISHTVKG